MKCGTKNEEGARFCLRCGSPLDTVSVGAPVQATSSPRRAKNVEKVLSYKKYYYVALLAFAYQVLYFLVDASTSTFSALQIGLSNPGSIFFVAALEMLFGMLLVLVPPILCFRAIYRQEQKNQLFSRFTLTKLSKILRGKGRLDIWLVIADVVYVFYIVVFGFVGIDSHLEPYAFSSQANFGWFLCVVSQIYSLLFFMMVHRTNSKKRMIFKGKDTHSVEPIVSESNEASTHIGAEKPTAADSPSSDSTPAVASTFTKTADTPTVNSATAAPVGNVTDSAYQRVAYQARPAEPVEDKASGGLKALSFFIPLAGFILWGMKKRLEPRTASSCAHLAWIGFALQSIVSIIIYVFYYMWLQSLYSTMYGFYGF
jgi:hypothetical protein